MKRCKRCGETKPLEDFYTNKGGRDGRRPECMACTNAARKTWYEQHRDDEIERVKHWQRRNRERYNARQRRWRAENRDRMREGHLRRTYGITQGDYERMLADQDGGCAICGDAPPDEIALHVDHDHDTGAVRGLLCVRCNNGIGLFREDDDLLGLISEYLVAPGPVRVEAHHLAGLARARARELVARPPV